MKIRTQADVDKLEEKIKKDLGVDIAKYRNEEVVENFVELLAFPVYVVDWTLRPILFFVLAYIIGFFLIDLVHIEYFLYGIIGFFLFSLTGLFFGLLLLIWKMKSDMWGILSYTLDIMESVVKDLKSVNHQMTDDNKQGTMSLLFKGIIHIVTIPVLSKTITSKIPFIGGLVSRIVKKILTVVSDKLKFDETELKTQLKEKGSESKIMEAYIQGIATTKKGLDKVLDWTMGIAQFPLKIGFGLFALLLVAFIYLLG